MRALVLLLAVASLFALAACGGTELDSKSFEEALPGDLTKLCKQSSTPCTDASGPVTEPIVSAECPSGISAKKGERFSCEVTLKGGEKTTAHLELTSDEGDYGFLGFAGGKK